MQVAYKDFLSLSIVPLNVQVFWPLSVIVPVICEVRRLNKASKTRQAFEKVIAKATMIAKGALRGCIMIF